MGEYFEGAESIESRSSTFWKVLPLSDTIVMLLQVLLFE